jgi:hypothetical protein
MHHYFKSVQQITPDTKQKHPLIVNSNHKLRENRDNYLSLINLAEESTNKANSDSKNIAAEIRKKQFHKTYNIILNKEASDNVEDDWRLIRKQQFEYPDYQVKIPEEDQDKIREFNFKKKQIKAELIESPKKSKDLQNFMKSVFTNKEEIKEVLDVMKELLDVRIDNRMLYTLRETLMSNNKRDNKHEVVIDDFRTAWRTLMNQEKHDQHPHVEYKLLAIITEPSGV